MIVVPTAIPDVLLVQPVVHTDPRGFFVETWHQARYLAADIPGPFVQDNQSRSVRHTLRGLHYQMGQSQGKLVRVSAGTVFDVAVDLRRSSPTFGHWVSAVLSDQNQHQLWAPPGFAHGFYVLSAHADVSYKCTTLYDAELDRAVRWDDPRIGIAWPLSDGVAPLLSPKDAAAPLLADAEVYP